MDATRAVMRHAFLSVFLFVSSVLFCQTSAFDRPHYLFFSNLDRDATEQKINDYAGKGYRLVGFQCNVSKAFVVVLENQGQPRYEYKLLAGYWQHMLRDKQPMIRQVSELSEQGYRIFRGSLLFFHPEYWAGQLNETGLVMERAIGGSDRYSYRASRTVLIGNAQKDLQAALHDGYEPLFTYSRPGERDMLFEKGPDTVTKIDPGAPQTQKSHRLLDSMFSPKLFNGSIAGEGFAIRNMRPKHVSANLASDISKGKHILSLSTGGNPDWVEAVVVSEPSAPKSLVLTVEDKRQRSGATSPTHTWEKLETQLNSAAVEGYVISLRPVLVTTTNFAISEFTLRLVIPMEISNGPRLRYKVVHADSLPLLSELTDQAERDGWRIVPGLLYGDRVVFLQKEDRP
jgi:hypothetical protein